VYKEHLAYNQTPERTASILTDEASAVHKGLLYEEVFPGDLSWYTSNIQTELGDLLVMARLLCEQKGWDPVELEKIGAERFLIRMKELKRGKRE